MKKSVILLGLFCSSLFAGDVIITPGGGSGSSDAAKLQGKEISTNVPTASQALVWNDTTKQWVPTSISVASTVSDTAYDATSWDGVTTFAPSKNAVRDKIETLVTSGGALGTPSSGTLTNATGLPIAGLTASTSTAIGVGSIELGHATDTTITRTGSGAIAVEGTAVLLSGGALGTPASGTVTNLTGTASININGTVGATTANTGEFTNLTLSGNQSAAAWTTSGLRLKGIAGTLTDTSSAANATIAAGYTNKLGGNTIAATNSNVTYTDYISGYFSEPVAGSNVTLTNKWALGADSLYVGTSTPVRVTNAGATSVANTTDSTTSTTGSLKTAGGLGVAKAVNVGTTLNVTGVSTLAGGGTSTTATAGDNTTQIATTAFVKAAVPTASYRTILQSNARMDAGTASGVKILSTTNGIVFVVSAGTFSAAYPPDLLYIAAADFPTVNGGASTMRVRAEVVTNGTAPGQSFTFGLYPLTKAASSGSGATNIYTVGTVVSGSTAVFTTPAADSLSTAVSSDFSLPADGYYAFGVSVTGSTTAGSQVQGMAHLQTRN